MTDEWKQSADREKLPGGPETGKQDTKKIQPTSPSVCKKRSSDLKTGQPVLPVYW